jgi:hypothetical protein
MLVINQDRLYRFIYSFGNAESKYVCMALFPSLVKSLPAVGRGAGEIFDE